jgi:hypothetical protein
MEFFSYENQEKLDRLVSDPEWNVALANEVLRDAEWTYIEYRDILEAAWKANQTALPTPPVKVIALGPPRDFRARKIGYDVTMAQRVKDYLTDGSKRVLVYCGMHHAFTRYLQVERREGGRATEFMDRFGNILWPAVRAGRIPHRAPQARVVRSRGGPDVGLVPSVRRRHRLCGLSDRTCRRLRRRRLSDSRDEVP